MLKPRIALDSGNDNSSIQSLIGDYEHVSAKIHEFDRRLESMQPLVTSLVQIVDARRSFAETANITRLTVLALVFVPLSYVSSLFSMNPNNLPGSPDFWVYVAVAIPLTLFVITIACPPVIQIREVVARLNSLRSRDDWARERMA
jgi:Mg2+ and Co2+ transporter CorA